MMQQALETRLQQAFKPVYLNIENETHMHNVPANAESHWKVTIVSDQFEGLMLIKRHRLVNTALKQEIEKIHALALHTMTPQEWFDKGGKVAESPPCEGGGRMN